MKTTSVPVLEMKGMSKSFGAVKAVQSVDLILHHAEILGLVGDNAAGKSTLMKLLSGVHKADQGEICIEGSAVRIESPIDARHLGIEMIYQDFSLVPNLSISDNIFLGKEETRSFIGLRILNRKKMEEVSRKSLSETNIEIESVNRIVIQLSGGQMQAVAIARATTFDAKIIIMDEPTASLSVKVIPQFLDLMRQLRDAGKSIILITHRLQDIFAVCNRVIVLRHGVCVGVSPIHETSVDEVIGLITGARETFGSVLGGR